MSNFKDKLDYFYSNKMMDEAYQYLFDELTKAMNLNNDYLVLAILNELLSYFRVFADFKTGESIINNILKIISKLKEENSIDSATTYLNIATFYKVAKKYQDAEFFYHKCQTIYNQNLDYNDQRYIAFLNNYSIFKLETNDPLKAIELATIAYNKIKDIKGCEIETAISASNLANMYLSNNELVMAQSLLHDSISLFEKHDPLDTHYFGTLAALGNSYHLIKNYPLALSTLKDVLDKIENVFGKNSDYNIVLDNYNHILKLSNNLSNGQKLMYDHYLEFAKKTLEEKHSNIYTKIAIGYIGPGSEGLGFDDDLSCDHDFGPGFCIWVSKDDFMANVTKLEETYYDLPQIYKGYQRITNNRSEKRVGIFEVNTFFKNYLGLIPSTDYEWLILKESTLSFLTSGHIYHDPSNLLLELRSKLNYYPKDVWLKKLAKHIAIMAQSGQYNLIRLQKRNDPIASSIALNTFIESTIHVIYLANKKYMPFYKWAYHGLKDFIVLKEVICLLPSLIELKDNDKLNNLIEQIAKLIVEYLNSTNLSTINDNFLENHVDSIINKISNDKIKRLHIMEG